MIDLSILSLVFFPCQTFLANFTKDIYVLKKEFVNIILTAVFGSLITNLVLGYFLYYLFYSNILDIT